MDVFGVAILFEIAGQPDAANLELHCVKVEAANQDEATGIGYRLGGELISTVDRLEQVLHVKVSLNTVFDSSSDGVRLVP